MPNVEFGYEDVHFTAEEIARRQAVISENSRAYLQAWQSGDVDPGLFGYQEDAFEALLKFTHETGLAEQPSIDETLIPSGYLDEPTSWGKTALMAKYMGAIGIGELPTPESPMPLRGLVGTMAQYAVKQTAGALDVSRGLKKFLPHLDITMCFAEHKKLSGSASVITYRMMLLLAKAGLLKDYYVDLVLGDEAHNLLGQETGKLWKPFVKNKRCIGVTASPEYGPHKKLSQIFDHLIHESTLRAHVEAGNVSAVQVMGFATGSEIEAPESGVDDFSDELLAPLRLDARRNQAICDATAHLVAEGRRGIINALPGTHEGQTLFHPRLLAKALDGREIEDESRNKRNIRAVAIGTHISAKACEKILQDFKKGEYDVVVQVDKINQSFDFEDVAFIVNAAPTLSPVRAIQRTGRLMRKSETWPVKVIVEFLDDIKGSRIPYTAWHVLGEREMMEQDQLFAPPELSELLLKHHNRGVRSGGGGGGGKPRRSRISIPNSEAFNDLLKAMHQDYALRLVETFTLKAKEGYGPPRPKWRELPALVAEKYSDRSLGIDGIRGVLEREGKKAGVDYCELAQGSRGPTYFVSPEAEIFLSSYDFPKKAPSRDWKTERELAEILDTTRDIIQRCSAGLDRKTYLAYRINREHEHFGPDEIAVIEQRVAGLKAQEEEAGTLISAVELSKEPEVNWERQSIHFFLTSHHGVKGRLLKNPGGGPDARFYTEEEAELVRRHRRHSYQVTQTALRQREIVDLEIETGRSRDEILAAATALGLTARVHDGRYKDSEGRYVYSELAKRWTAKQIKVYLEQEPGDPIAPDEQKPPVATKPAPESVPEPKPEPPEPASELAFMPPPPPDMPRSKPMAVQFTAPRLASPGTVTSDPKPSTESTEETQTTPPDTPDSQPLQEAEPTPQSEPKAEPKPAPVPKIAPNAAATVRPNKVNSKQSAPAPSSAQPISPPEEKYLDILEELRSLGAPCEEGALGRVLQSCSIRQLKKEGGKLLAKEADILKLAERITKIFMAPPALKTAEQVAQQLGISMEKLVEIVGKLSVNTYSLMEVYRSTTPDGKPGAAALYMRPQLQALIEKAVKNRRLIPRALERRPKDRAPTDEV